MEKKMKNIIIAGTSRVGKTTLSVKLAKELHYNYYKMDSIKVLLSQFLEEEKSKDWKKISPIMVNCIEEIIKRQNQEQDDIPIIFDTCHIYPQDIEKLKDDYIIYYLGFADSDEEEYKKQIRQHDPETAWTKKLNDEELLEITKSNIYHSRELKEQCEKCGIQFYDLAKERETKINEIEHNIIYQINKF